MSLNAAGLQTNKGIINSITDKLIMRHPDLPEQFLLGKERPKELHVHLFREGLTQNQFTFPYFEIPRKSDFSFMKEPKNSDELYHAFMLLLSHQTLEDMYEILLEKFDFFGNFAFKNSDMAIINQFSDCLNMVFTQRLQNK